MDNLIKKLIEREERNLADAEKREDVHDMGFYLARKRAFEEVKPFLCKLQEEKEDLQAKVEQLTRILEKDLMGDKP